VDHRLRREIFYLAFHMHWSWKDAMELETHDRLAYVRLLAERIESDNQAKAAAYEAIRRG